MRASPRGQPFKLLREVWSHVNNHSPPSPWGRLQKHFMPSNPRQAPVYLRFHCPAQGASSGGTTSSLCLALLSCAILSQVGLLEVPVTYLESLSYFLAQGPVLLNDCSSKKLMLNRGFRVCSSLISGTTSQGAVRRCFLR
jgi:hypothetical protein